MEVYDDRRCWSTRSSECRPENKISNITTKHVARKRTACYIATQEGSDLRLVDEYKYGNEPRIKANTYLSYLIDYTQELLCHVEWPFLYVQFTQLIALSHYECAIYLETFQHHQIMPLISLCVLD